MICQHVIIEDLHEQWNTFCWNVTSSVGSVSFFITSPPAGVRSIVLSMFVWLSVRLSVCLSTRIISEASRPNFANFCACCLWPWLGHPHPLTALRYVVLPVLWLTSCFHGMGPMVCYVSRERRELQPTLVCRFQPNFTQWDQQVHIVGCALGEKSAVYHCIVLFLTNCWLFTEQRITCWFAVKKLLTQSLTMSWSRDLTCWPQKWPAYDIYYTGHLCVFFWFSTPVSCSVFKLRQARERQRDKMMASNP